MNNIGLTQTVDPSWCPNGIRFRHRSTVSQSHRVTERGRAYAMCNNKELHVMLLVLGWLPPITQMRVIVVYEYLEGDWRSVNILSAIQFSMAGGNTNHKFWIMQCEARNKMRRTMMNIPSTAITAACVDHARLRRRSRAASRCIGLQTP